MASISAESDRQFYLDARCKFSNKEGLSRSRSSTQSLMKNSSQRKCGLTRKCSRLVKELRARFYIIRRCITMLICWSDYTDS